MPQERRRKRTGFITGDDDDNDYLSRKSRKFTLTKKDNKKAQGRV
jgi:hypothetical protein